MRVHNLAKSALLFGYLAISASIAVAYTNPVTGYELDIYAGTPLAFWVLVTFALLVSIAVTFSVPNRHLRAAGGFLGGLTMLVTVALPIYRGYHYLGDHDSLSHLGTAKVISEGTMPMTESRYPVVHTLGGVLHTVTGLSIRHVMLVSIIVFVGCFLLFVPLVVRELTGSVWTSYIGLFSGLLLLPINHVGSHHYVFPTSQAIMYAPAFLLVFFLLFHQRTARLSALFLIVAPAFVLLHPQQAANLLLFFGVIVAGQIGSDFLTGVRFERWRRWLLPEVTFFAGVFALWVWNLDIFWGFVVRTLMIPFQDTTIGGKAATRTGSVDAVGGSLLEIFLKLFSVQFAFVLLTGLLLFWVIRRLRTDSTRSLLAAKRGQNGPFLPIYVFAGLTAVTLLFVVFLVGGISDQYFRHLGMMMVFGTILGAIALGRATQYLGQRWSPGAAKSVAALTLCLCLLVSIPVVFASPYIYYDSQQVSEEQMHGYETTFEHRDSEILFDDIRSSTYRYGHAIDGSDRPPAGYYPEGDDDVHSGEHGIPDHFANRSLRTYYEGPRYIPVPEADRTRDPVLWDGFRFSHEDFAYLESEPGIDKVQSNGGYDLYLVEPAPDSPQNGSSAS